MLMLGEESLHESPNAKRFKDALRYDSCVIHHGATPSHPLPPHSYTSLDGVEDTEKNPHLAVSTETQLLTGQPCVTGGYLPAYMLANEEHERAGRSTS